MKRRLVYRIEVPVDPATAQPEAMVKALEPFGPAVVLSASLEKIPKPPTTAKK
jgi:hypothetical protein